MNYKTYDNYKDSNEKWIGVVPESWVVKPIREFYDYRSEKVSDKVYQPLSVTKKGILPQLEHAAKTDNNDSRKKVKIGDFVINSRSDRKGSCGVSPYEGSVSLIYHVLKSKDSSIDKYAHHLFRSVMFAEEFYKWGHGIVDDLWSTRWDEMKKIKIPMPPKDERIHIGQYLDKKTNQINEQINLNEKLIELLEEKRVALINQVVTKGLNPDVELRDSGVEWIGEIPEHWEIIKVKNCSDIINDKKDFADENDKYIGLEHIESETGKLLNYSNNGADGTVNKFKKDMVLFGKLRPYLAKVINTSFDGVCSTELLVFKTNDSLLSRYLFYFMLSNRFIEQVNSSTYGVKMPRASPDFINSMYIALPNTIEQKGIIDYLDSKTMDINNTISKIQKNISLLEEYKTSLIHHVVTGKIDVRGEEI